MNLQKNVGVALAAAVLCVLSPFAIPLGFVPLTFATVGVYLAACLLGPWRGAAAVGVYLLLGAVGVPVFAGFIGGAQQLFGLTGGFLWGYIPCAVVIGLLAERSERLTPLWLLCGTVVLYTAGTGWYIGQTGASLPTAMLACVMPFLVMDGIKIVAASVLLAALRKRTRRM